VIGLAAWGPTIVAAITMIFTAGLLVGRIRNQELTLKDHHDRLDSIDTRLDGHSDRLARSEAWREGYNAATKASLN